MNQAVNEEAVERYLNDETGFKHLKTEIGGRKRRKLSGNLKGN